MNDEKLDDILVLIDAYAEEHGDYVSAKDEETYAWTEYAPGHTIATREIKDKARLTMIAGLHTLINPRTGS
jgi:hypothetical protein